MSLNGGGAGSTFGSRVAAGLGPLVPQGSLTGLLQPIVAGPTPSFLDAIKPVDESGIIPSVMAMAEVTLALAQDQRSYGELLDDPLSADGIAYVMKYSAEDSVPPLYQDMNNKCYDKDRKKIMPYGMFMVGLVKHMKDIEVYPNATVYRGVKVDLKAHYVTGRKFTWHGFCSTTKSMGVLSNPQFCGETGKRTIFAIQLTQGQAREITRYSMVASEDEVLLPPGCRFQVIAVLPQGDLTIIQLQEQLQELDEQQEELEEGTGIRARALYDYQAEEDGDFVIV